MSPGKTAANTGSAATLGSGVHVDQQQKAIKAVKRTTQLQSWKHLACDAECAFHTWPAQVDASFRAALTAAVPRVTSAAAPSASGASASSSAGAGAGAGGWQDQVGSENYNIIPHHTTKPNHSSVPHHSCRAQMDGWPCYPDQTLLYDSQAVMVQETITGCLQHSMFALPTNAGVDVLALRTASGLFHDMVKGSYFRQPNTACPTHHTAHCRCGRAGTKDCIRPRGPARPPAPVHLVC
jgi:hypothetical protein